MLFFTGLTSVPIWDKVFGISFLTHNHHPSSGALFKVDLIGISSEFPLGFVFFCSFFEYKGGWDPFWEPLGEEDVLFPLDITDFSEVLN